MLISEEPITYYTALDLPPKGMATVQWDMYEAEKIGLDKYDILSQRGIGHFKQAVKLAESNQQRKIDIHDVKTFMKAPWSMPSCARAIPSAAFISNPRPCAN